MNRTFAGMGAGSHMLNGHVIPGAAIGMHLLAAYDKDPSRAAVITQHPAAAEGARGFDSFDKFIEWATKCVDAFVIATPDDVHAAQLLELVKRLADRGLRTPILLDKPLAINSADMDMLAEAIRIADRFSIPLTSCLVRHFDPPYMWLVEHFPQLLNDLGRLKDIEMTFDYPQPGSSWKRDGRSLMFDHAIHELGVLVQLFPQAAIMMHLEKDGPLEYRIEGTIGEGNREVSFTLHGLRQRERPRSDDGFGLFAESVVLVGTKGRCVLDTALGDTTMYLHSGAYRVPSRHTDYDARLQGVMANLRDMTEGRTAYIDPSTLHSLTRATVDLKEGGKSIYLP